MKPQDAFGCTRGKLSVLREPREGQGYEESKVIEPGGQKEECACVETLRVASGLCFLFMTFPTITNVT